MEEFITSLVTAIVNSIVTAGETIATAIRENTEEMATHNAWIRENWTSGGGTPPPDNGGGTPPSADILVVKTLPSKTNLHVITGFDAACLKNDPAAEPTGKPETTLPPIGNKPGDRTQYPPGTFMQIAAKASISCIDDKNTKTVFAAGMEKMNIVVAVRNSAGEWVSPPPNTYGTEENYQQILCREADVQVITEAG